MQLASPDDPINDADSLDQYWAIRIVAEGKDSCIGESRPECNGCRSQQS